MKIIILILISLACLFEGDFLSKTDWYRIKSIYEMKIKLEPNPDKKADIEEELSSLALDLFFKNEK